jgi:hypothetical protein
MKSMQFLLLQDADTKFYLYPSLELENNYVVRYYCLQNRVFPSPEVQYQGISSNKHIHVATDVTLLGQLLHPSLLDPSVSLLGIQYPCLLKCRSCLGILMTRQ